MGHANGTKARVLNVAFRLIWGQSYGSVSVDQICSGAAVQKGSFYHFFPSKSEMAIEAYEEHWRSCQAAYDRIFSAQTVPLARLEKFCQLLYEWQRAKFDESGQILGCPFASIGAELSTQDHKIRDKTREMVERLCNYLESALADAYAAGLIERNDVKRAVQDVYSLIIGALFQAKIRNSLEVLEGLYPAILRLAQASSVRNQKVETVLK